MKVTTDGCLFGAWAAQEIQKSKVKIQNILDAGAGTGLLSLMVAQQCEASIMAVEIDAAAAEEAAENFNASPWSGRLKLMKGDLRQMNFTAPFDVIICNPPFYETDLKGPDEQRNTAHHSRLLTLKELFPFLFRNLAPQGTIFLLLPNNRKQELLPMIRENGLFLHKQVDVIPSKRATRWMVALKKFKAGQVASGSLQVKIESGYTMEFRWLLQDYYLHL